MGSFKNIPAIWAGFPIREESTESSAVKAYINQGELSVHLECR